MYAIFVKIAYFVLRRALEKICRIYRERIKNEVI